VKISTRPQRDSLIQALGLHCYCLCWTRRVFRTPKDKGRAGTDRLGLTEVIGELESGKGIGARSLWSISSPKTPKRRAHAHSRTHTTTSSLSIRFPAALSMPGMRRRTTGASHQGERGGCSRAAAWGLGTNERVDEDEGPAAKTSKDVSRPLGWWADGRLARSHAD
jgi:hypothetical protein